MSKFGDMDITGDGAMEFFSNRIKITSKWPLVRDPASGTSNGGIKRKAIELDRANFAGSM